MSAGPLQIKLTADFTDAERALAVIDGFDERTLSPVFMVDGWPVDQAGRFIPAERWLREFTEGSDAR